MSLIGNIAKKIDAGIRLTETDALTLFESAELTPLGKLADEVNRRKNHDTVFFNVNRHINPTNICALSCKFCAYSRKPGEAGGYAYSIEEMVQKAGEAVNQGATEVHMVGGLHPRWKLDHYKEMIGAVKTAHPGLHIKAFTAVELDWFARRARLSVKEVLLQLKEVGLGSLPGGGAEIFHPEIRDQICETKVSGEEWIDTHRTAHELGMHSNCTMLYGHIESYHHRVDHMRRLRELQDETGGFNAFIPLAFQPYHNDLGIGRYTFGYDDLKTLAIARLYLDNFRHIKAYWIMLGQDIAQLALQFGANDLDGTVIEEKISRMAGGRSGMTMSRSFIENLIVKAKRYPCERDTLYNALPPLSAKAVAPAAAAPVPPPEAQTLINLITKIDYGTELALPELVLLAQHASVHELGRLAMQTPERQAQSGKGSLAPAIVLDFARLTSVGEAVRAVERGRAACLKSYQTAPTMIALDLAPLSQGALPGQGDGTSTFGQCKNESFDFGDLLEVVWALRQTYADLELGVWGLKGLWSLAQDENVTLNELLARLVDAGVDNIASSPHETETDLTHTEISELHRQIHAADLETYAKVELIAPTHGRGEPLWESFLRRIATFTSVAEETGRLAGISIEASPGSLITATEYLRAIAIARIAARHIPVVIAPLALIPTLSPAPAKLTGATATPQKPTGPDGEAIVGDASRQHPAEKLASLCLHYGATDLGAIDINTQNPLAVMQQIRASGLIPVLRGAPLPLTQDAKAAEYSGSLPLAALAGLRHLPELSTPTLAP